jgi:hypothetical protein
MAKPLKHVEREGNIAQKKNLNPQVRRPMYWQEQAPEHVEEKGSEEQKKHVELAYETN